ncbi:MAG: hypothetical protein ABFD96_07165 [Armatimonadia bacterium]
MALTVKMLVSITHLGTLYTAGTSPSLADDLARQWVYEGRAQWVSADTQPLKTPVMWSNMLGAQIIKPNGVAISIQDSAAVAITGGTINGATIGQTTPAAVKTSNLAATFTDSSATPGNVTNSSPRGRVAVAAAASAVTVTSTLVAATSTVFAVVSSVDATLLEVLRVVPAAGSFTITCNAAATAATKVDFMVIN